MPDKPTDKKLTFVEWLAKEHYVGNIEYAKGVLRAIMDDIIRDGIHKGDCTNESEPCLLCTLETMLSEYHKYFKQNN